MVASLYEFAYPIYRRTALSERLRRRRFERITRLLGLQPGASVLEVGCGRGVDFAQFATGTYAVTGIDVADVDRVCAFDFRQLDARSLPWPDKHFDAVVSIGVLEHVQPLDVLCQVTNEVRRVARRFCVIVPSAGTLLEPHTWSPLWQLRDRRTKPQCAYELNYFSDEAWLQFPGFIGATTQRYWHAPGVQNLIIYSK
jgi:ubiquinone/menaquinone biosynthesis C-methylase UbiE